MGTERKMKECGLCVKRGTECGAVAEGIKGCSGYIGATKEDRMLHSIFFEEEYFTRESRLIYYMEWLPIYQRVRPCRSVRSLRGNSKAVYRPLRRNLRSS